MDKINRRNTNQTSGADLIKEERNRQINQEGYSSEHDDKHSTEVFVSAAISYAAASYNKELSEDMWPWEQEYYKPKTELRNLVRAGALIAAAIDKILRTQANEEGSPTDEAKDLAAWF